MSFRSPIRDPIGMPGQARHDNLNDDGLRNYRMETTNKLSVMTILGTRPEIIRLSRILPAMDEVFDQTIVFTRQSFDYEMSDIFFAELELRQPDVILEVKASSLGKQIANIIAQTEGVLLKSNPDAVLILGDTNSSLSAIVAKRRKIPIFHLEAGNRAFDWDVPEEVNRRIVDHLSDYNLCYTEHARRYLLAEGMAPQTVFVTGSPYPEIFAHFKDKIDKTPILKTLGLTSRKYFVASIHREENVENASRLTEILTSLGDLAKQYKLPVILSLHPRTKQKLGKAGNLSSLIQTHKPFGFLEYVKLQKEALCVLSDSGTIQEESAILGFPAVQLRVSTERPEAFDAGSIVVAGFNRDTIVSGVTIVVEEKKQNAPRVVPRDYQDINVSAKVVKLILGFTSIRKYHRR